MSTRSLRHLSCLTLLSACSGTGPAPAGGASDTAATTTDTPTDTGPAAAEPLELSDITWSLHPEIGAIVQVSWQQSTDATLHVSFGPDGETPLTSPATMRQAGAQQVLLLGVPYDTDFTFRLVSDTVTSEPIAARTGPLPEGVPLPVVTHSDPSAWVETDRWLLIGVSGDGGEGWNTETFWKLILDRQGRVVWAHETPDGDRTFYMQPAQDGASILWDEDSFWTDFDHGKGSVAHRMTLDGTILETIPLPGMHHAFLELPDGAFLWGGTDQGREVLRERDAQGNVRRIWDCSAYWQQQGASDSCDGNALFWNDADGTIYFSSDSGHSVVELDRQTGTVIHVWGQLPNAWPFAEGSSTFWKQHSPTRTPEGNLLLSMWTDERNHELLAREYEIDEKNQILREVWSCGQGSGIRADYAGEAHRLQNGNTMLNYGAGGAIREYAPDCTVVWHLGWTQQNMTGRATFLHDLYSFVP